MEMVRRSLVQTLRHKTSRNHSRAPSAVFLIHKNMGVNGIRLVSEISELYYLALDVLGGKNRSHPKGDGIQNQLGKNTRIESICRRWRLRGRMKECRVS